MDERGNGGVIFDKSMASEILAVLQDVPVSFKGASRAVDISNALKAIADGEHFVSPDWPTDRRLPIPPIKEKQ
jgi:hypothetical protein